MNLSEHFTLKEALKSAKAEELRISNIPDAGDLDTLIATANKMELVRKILGDKAIIITSWYRNAELNRAVGGVPTSQHKTGEAVDFKIVGMDNYRAIHILRTHAKELQFDQLIWEPTWIHISFLTSAASLASGKKPRMQYIDMHR